MKKHTTNYHNTLILVSEDCPASSGTIPPIKDTKKSIARHQYEWLSTNPLSYNSDEVIFGIYAVRQDFSFSELAEQKEIFFSKGQPCLRTSPLAKTYGWGIFFNDIGKIKLIDSSSEEYLQLIQNNEIQKIYAMKSKKN